MSEVCVEVKVLDMGVGLPPLEFTECLADSPQFRENLQRHEKELDRTSQQIKRLIKEVKDVVHAAKRLSAAQLALASSMEQLEFACIGASLTDDERIITRSLRTFAQLMRTVEDERERMLSHAHAQIIEPLEKFRKEHIGNVKEGKKKFDKKTAKFCQTQERTLALSTKKPDAVFQEADAAMEMASRDFCQASLEYVFQLQAVQERKKFEVVEPLLGFVFSWWTFHHTAHDVRADAEPLAQDLQLRIQRTRTNFEETSKQTETLMKKMMDIRIMSKDVDNVEEPSSHNGYLFLMEKKAFGTTWTKQYATYEKNQRMLNLLPYNQINTKSIGVPETIVVNGGARPLGEGAERRFCWEASGAVLQALDERNRRQWLRTINTNAQGAVCNGGGGGAGTGSCALDEAGFSFARALVTHIEAHHLDEQGLYRVGGVTSKVSKLLSLVSSPSGLAATISTCDVRTLTSALKAFLRALPEPLLTRRLHHHAVRTMQLERRSERINAVRQLVRELPPRNYEMLHLVIMHLRRVSEHSATNLMSASNLSVCFGPTLMWPERQTVAAILELKFYNVLVESLIEHAHPIFNNTAPAPMSNDGSRTDLTSLCSRASLNTARFLPQQQCAVTQLAPLQAMRGVCRSSSSSAESLSSASPPPPRPAPPPAPLAPLAPHAAHQRHYNFTTCTRVRTLYACLGESDGELSFEPNQIITHVTPSGEPGWLRGTLRGTVGLVPENYVEPLP